MTRIHRSLTRAGAVIAVAYVLPLIGATAAQADSCPNAQYRTGLGASLPDCRAYEQVSPVDKNGLDADIVGSGSTEGPEGPATISADGNTIAFPSLNSFDNAPSAPFLSEYRSTRAATNWDTLAISPLRTAQFGGIDVHTMYEGFSSDLSQGAVVNWVSPGTYDLELRNADGAFTTLATGAASTTGANAPFFAGATSDFSHILVETDNQGSGAQLYEWANGTLTPTPINQGLTSSAYAGVSVSSASTAWGRAISSDGSKVFWSGSGSGNGGPYMYDSATGQNTLTVVNQCTTGNTGLSGEGGNCSTTGSSLSGTFQTSTSDGSAELFTDNLELTNQSNTGTNHQGSDLYSYDTATGTETDLTPDSTDADGAIVQGVVAATDDDSYIYFAASGVLAPGATAGTCGTFCSGTPTTNLYVLHNGITTYIARLSGQDGSGDFEAASSRQTHSEGVQLSPDGQHLLFVSAASPTAYNSGGEKEVYLYDAGSDQLSCVSCSSSGAPAVSGASLGTTLNSSWFDFDNMSSDGDQVFFQSTDQLLPQDSNGMQDVYEWEGDGSGTCDSNAYNGGCLFSISSGSSSSADYFLNVTPSANDALIETRQELVVQDDDSAMDIYDARVDGGLVGQEAGAAAPPCASSVGCEGTAAAPLAPATAATLSFSGPGNPAVSGTKPKPTPKVKVTTRTARGDTLGIRVKVPGKGRVTISGNGIVKVSRSFKRAGSYRMRVSLAPKERRLLKRKHRVRLKLTVRYAPANGRVATTRFMVTVLGGAR